MSRLTRRISVENEEVIVYTKGEYTNTTAGEMRSSDVREVMKKLAEYEDLEEQGLLLKLPYPLGTKKVYVVDDYEIYELNATEITFCKADIFAKIPYKTVICVDCWDFYYEDFGKTVFLTKEEAEQELKRLEGAE